MVDKAILFVYGAGRSGTTYINGMLRDFFDYGMCAEGRWVLRMAKKYHKYGDLKFDENLHRLIDDILKDYMFEDFRYRKSRTFGRCLDVTREDILRNLPQRNYEGIIYAAFSSIAEQLRKTRVGNKCPSYSNGLLQLVHWFPNAQFLHIVRDGRDVALSTMKEIWGQKSAFTCAQTWVAVHEAASQLSKRVSPKQHCMIQYEQLLQEPEMTIQILEDFLRYDMPTDSRQSLLNSITENPRRHNFGKWRDQMSESDIRIYEAIGGSWLQRYGYPTVCKNPKVSQLEKLVFRSNEMARKIKWTFQSHYSQNPEAFKR